MLQEKKKKLAQVTSSLKSGMPGKLISKTELLSFTVLAEHGHSGLPGAGIVADSLLYTSSCLDGFSFCLWAVFWLCLEPSEVLDACLLIFSASF